VTNDRLRGILGRPSELDEEDPAVVEARLRNMVYGTNRKWS
jgi:hypothetical protein